MVDEGHHEYSSTATRIWQPSMNKSASVGALGHRQDIAKPWWRPRLFGRAGSLTMVSLTDPEMASFFCELGYNPVWP